jgi:hypothetical protein
VPARIASAAFAPRNPARQARCTPVEKTGSMKQAASPARSQPGPQNCVLEYE